MYAWKSAASCPRTGAGWSPRSCPAFSNATSSTTSPPTWKVELDEISGGRIEWKSVLVDFWKAFSAAVDDTKDLRTRQVLDSLDALLGPHFFPDEAARVCPQCGEGRLSLKLGRYGAFIGCSNYPECRHTRKLTMAGEGENGTAENGDRVLGTDPATGLEVSLKKGPYGLYVQMAAAEEGAKPKRASLPKSMPADSVELDTAVALLALPRDIGAHPETGDMISAGIGRFGPYVRHRDTYVSLKGDDDVLSVGINRAVDLIGNAATRAAAKSLGEHPSDKKPVTLKAGRFGPYVQHGTERATLPKGVEADTVTLEEAVAILAAKAARGGGAKSQDAGQLRPQGGQGEDRDQGEDGQENQRRRPRPRPSAAKKKTTPSARRPEVQDVGKL